MIYHDSVLVQLVRLVDTLPVSPPSSTPRRRGRPVLYSDTLFLKALVIMIVRRLHKVGELLAVLEEPTQEMRSLRELLTGPDGRFPSRRTIERRLRALPSTEPGALGGLHCALLVAIAVTGRPIIPRALAASPLVASAAQEVLLFLLEGLLDEVAQPKVGQVGEQARAPVFHPV